MKKLKVLIRPAIFLAITMLCAVSVRAQERGKDTIKVVMLVCDTSDYSGNKINALGQVFWVYGYSVGEKHNEAEGVTDPGFYMGRVWKDYRVHLQYLDDKKRPLLKSYLVWQSVAK